MIIKGRNVLFSVFHSMRYVINTKCFYSDENNVKKWSHLLKCYQMKLLSECSYNGSEHRRSASKPKMEMEERFENIIDSYLDALEQQQDQVYNIRLFHHEIWRFAYINRGISEIRIGSNVERYTRIYLSSMESDFDVLFEVKNIDIECTCNSPIYLELCENKAYGKVYLTKEGRCKIRENILLSKMFKDVERPCKESQNHVVDSTLFKTNVIEHCQFDDIEIHKGPDITLGTGPAVKATGNQHLYDLVPCLKLRSWPTAIRKRVEEMYNFTSPDGTKVRIFIVPTGDPLSKSRNEEWRLSFTLLEIEIFKQMSSHQRQLYGILRYIFKVALEKEDLLKSYHLKVLFLWKLEEDDLSNEKPVSFVLDFLRHIVSSLEKQNIPHYFIDGCNIFPVHKFNQEKKAKYMSKIDDVIYDLVRREIKAVISQDLSIKTKDSEMWLQLATREMLYIRGRGLSEEVIAGYLTRLLGVICYCLKMSRRCDKDQFNRVVAHLQRLVTFYGSDTHVQRIIPFIKSVLKDVYDTQLDVSPTSCHSVVLRDQVSFLGHSAFHCYVQQDFSRAKALLDQAKTQDREITYHGKTIGVTITIFDREVDAPLKFVLDHYRNVLMCTRFYVCVNVLVLHLKIQLYIRDIQNGDSSGIQEVIRLLKTLVTESSNLSFKEPYPGNLSYANSSLLLVKGYRQYFAESPSQVLKEMKQYTAFDERLFDRDNVITNFDLR